MSASRDLDLKLSVLAFLGLFLLAMWDLAPFLFEALKPYGIFNKLSKNSINNNDYNHII